MVKRPEILDRAVKAVTGAVKAHATHRRPIWREFYLKSLAPALEKEIESACTAIVMGLMKRPFRGLFAAKVEAAPAAAAAVASVATGQGG